MYDPTTCRYSSAHCNAKFGFDKRTGTMQIKTDPEQIWEWYLKGSVIGLSGRLMNVEEMMSRGTKEDKDKIESELKRSLTKKIMSSWNYSEEVKEIKFSPLEQGRKRDW